MNSFVLFGDGAITRKKKMTEILHHALRAMMHAVSCHFFSGDTPSPNKKNRFIP
jgi:hypothetical protein